MENGVWLEVRRRCEFLCTVVIHFVALGTGFVTEYPFYTQPWIDSFSAQMLPSVYFSWICVAQTAVYKWDIYR